LTNLAVSLAVANAVSNNVAGINLRDFLLAGTSFSDTYVSGYRNSGDPFNSIITLGEIFKGNQGAASRPPVGEQLMTNLKANWLPLSMSVIGIPIIAGVATKLLRKPVILPANRMLKSIGLKDVKI